MSTKLNEILKHQENNTVLRRHAQILLDTDESHASYYFHQKVALRSRTTLATVISAIKKFLDEGLDSAVAYHRNLVSAMTRQKISGANEARLIELACSDASARRAWWLQLGRRTCESTVRHAR